MTESLKVAMLGSSSGVLRYHLARLSMALVDCGLEVFVVSAPREQVPGLRAELDSVGVRQHTCAAFDRLEPLHFLKAASHLSRALDKESADLIHANGVLHASLGRFAQNLRRSRKVLPIVTSVHYLPLEDMPSSWLTWKVFAGSLNSFASRCVAVSEYTRGMLVKHGVSAQKTEIIHNGVDPEEINRSSRRSTLHVEKRSEDVSIVCVGDLVPAKGQELLLEATAILLRTHNAQVYLVGDGPSRAFLQARTRQLGIESHVHFLGRILWPDVYWILRELADLCVSTSVRENFPYYVLECMASGKPLVAIEAGGISEAVANGVTGYLLPPCRADLLAERIGLLIDSPSTRRSMGAAGRDRVIKRFTLSRMALQLIETYKRALNSNERTNCIL